MKPSRPFSLAVVMVAGAVLLTGCVNPPTPSPSTSQTSSDAPDSTRDPNQTADPSVEEPYYDAAEAAAEFAELGEVATETVVAIPESVTVPEKKNLNDGMSEPGPIPIPGALSEQAGRWIVDVKGWEVTDTLPGAGPAPAGQQYAVAYLDVALREGGGSLGTDMYFSLSTTDGAFYAHSAHPENYDGDYLYTTWDGPGLKQGIVAAVLVPAGSEISSFALSLYGNGSLLAVDAAPVEQ